MAEKVFCDFCGEVIPNNLPPTRCSVTVHKDKTLMLAKDACSSCAEQIRRVLTLGAGRLDRLVDSLTGR